MMNILERVLRMPKVVLTIMVVLLAAGVLSYVSLPKESFPAIDVPYFYISVSETGVSPSDAERLLGKPIEDRIKDMVLRGGENVYCAEVEAAFHEHPAVHEVAVFGVPHERLGEEVAAVVMLRDGSSATEQELLDFVAGRLAAFKVPTRLRVTGEPLPRNAAGKFLKRELRRSEIDWIERADA